MNHAISRSDHCIGITVSSAICVGLRSASDFGTSSPRIIWVAVRPIRIDTAEGRAALDAVRAVIEAANRVAEAASQNREAVMTVDGAVRSVGATAESHAASPWSVSTPRAST